MSIILLLALFNAANCNIYIDIALFDGNQTVMVSVGGRDRELISNEDQKAFSLTPEQINEDLDKVGLPAPNHIYVQKSSHFGHRDIYTVLKPLAATITNFTKTPVVLYNKTFFGDDTMVAKHRMTINENRLERMIVRWNTEKELSLGRDIMIRFAGRHILRSAWNQNETKLWDSKMSSRSRTEFKLKPRQNATVVVTAIRAHLELKVDYVAILDGDLYFLQTILFIPVKQKAMDVNLYFYVTGASGLVGGYQTIIADFYFAGQLSVQEVNGEMILDPVPFP